MKIAIVGMTALLGEKIASECKNRGMEVTSFIGGAEGDVKLSKDILGQFDAVIDAAKYYNISECFSDTNGPYKNVNNLNFDEIINNYKKIINS